MTVGSAAHAAHGPKDPKVGEPAAYSRHGPGANYVIKLRNKANIRHIQELLGHASLNTTQVYAAVSITDLKEAHAKCHPRERESE